MRRPSESAADRRIAAYLQAQGRSVLSMQIGDIAKACETSEAGIVRYCKRLGFSGLKDYKISLAADPPQPMPEARISGTESVPELRRKILQGGIDALQNTDLTLNNEALQQAIDALSKARNIDVYALGGSVPIGTYFRHQLIKIGVRVSLYTERYTMLYSQAQQGPQDVAMAISCSGETPDILEAMSSACKNGATTICLTDHPDSSLARLAQICLISPIGHLMDEEDNTYSRLAQFVIINILYAGMCCRGS